MTNIRKFNHPMFGEVRATVDNHNVVWFVGNDVAEKLGYSRPRKAISDHCKGSTVLGIPSNGGTQMMKIIPEGDVYRLIFKSRLPEAEAFESWVVNDVLPTIRQTGSYQVPQYKIPQTYGEALRLAANLQDKIEQDAPKVAYHDTVLSADNGMNITTIAKELGISGRSLNTELHNKGIQYKQDGVWVLYVQHQDKGWTTLATETYEGSDGEIKTRHRTLWTEEGRKAIHEILGN